jgi:hypothetical protein
MSKDTTVKSIYVLDISKHAKLLAGFNKEAVQATAGGGITPCRVREHIREASSQVRK